MVFHLFSSILEPLSTASKAGFAQDRQAVKLLMALRDSKPQSASQGRRWGFKALPRAPELLRKSGNLLDATEDFIVHQCN